MKRRKPVSYAEDDYSDEFEYEEADRNRDIDNNKVTNGRNSNRESRSGSRSRTNPRGGERIKKPKLSSDSDSDSDSNSDSNGVVSNGKILLSTMRERDGSPSDKESSPSSSSENKPQGPESDLMALESDDGNRQEEESWWELDAESGKYREKGPNLKGFKLKLKMRVKVRDDHLVLRHVEAGNAKIKCEVKVDNVRESLGIKHGSVDQPIRMETHTPETHPLICPFFCSETNIPCEVSFQMIDQKYFLDHVSNGKCPYSKGKKLEDFLPSSLLTCDLCEEEVPENEAQKHMDQKHFKICCPACKNRYQDRIDVEDHIINDHATHFISQLTSIYRKTNLNKKTTIKIKQPEPEPEPEEETEPERPEYTYLEDLIREKKEQDAMIREQAQYLAGLKGPDQANSANRFLLNMSSSPGQAGQLRPPRPAQPRLPVVNRGPRPRAVLNNYAQRMFNSQTNRLASPGGLRPRAPPPIAPVAQEGLQQVRLQNGSLVWAMAKEIVPGVGGAKNKMLYQVLCPVVPGAPPPLLMKKTGPTPAPAPAPRSLAPLAPLAPQPRGRLIPRQSVLRPPAPFKYKQHMVKRRPKVALKRPPQPPQLPRPPQSLPSNGFPSNSVDRMVKSSNSSGHSHQQSRSEMDDEIEEIDPHDPLAMDEGVDPLAGLDPYEDEDKEITIVS